MLDIWKSAPQSRCVFWRISGMLESLKAQKEIYREFNNQYFFCSTTGQRVNPSNLRQRVRLLVLEKAGLKKRK